MTIFKLSIFLFITSLVTSQTINLEITENTNSPYLIGKIDKSGLEGENYKSWFTTNYNAYQTSDEITNSISKELNNYEIILFMGTWCGDSKMEVPRLYKVLESSNFPKEKLSVIALGKTGQLYKQSPQHEEKGLDIHRVPTVIFYKNGKEMNRIVEHPIDSFEEDILNIITKNDYKSNYQTVTYVQEILKNSGIKGLNKKQNEVVRLFKDKVSSMYELNTFGRVLFSSGQKEKAIAVFHLNTKLFPNQPRTYMSLANTLGVTGKRKQAIKVLEKAVEIFPDNQDLKNNLDVIKTN